MALVAMAGTLRVCSAEETLARLTPILPKVGITRVANVTGLDNISVPVVTCIRPASKHVAVSQGKGHTLTLAKVSGIMEAIEGYHAEQPLRVDLKGDYCTLSKSALLVNPNDFKRNIFTQDLSQIELNWSECQEIVSHKTAYIPSDLVNLDFTRYGLPYGYFSSGSNGLAAGNTQVEAVCHALYELIERDALVRWQQQEDSDCMAIDLSTVTDEAITLILTQLTHAKQAIQVWDITSTLGIPTFQCVIIGKGRHGKKRIFQGSGTHIDKTIALSRAITEAIQTRLTLISGNRDDIFPDYYLHSLDVEQGEFIDMPMKSFDDVNKINYGNTLSSHLALLIKILMQHDFNQVYVVDRRLPDIDVPVVQVFVPGLLFSGIRVSGG